MKGLNSFDYLFLIFNSLLIQGLMWIYYQVIVLKVDEVLKRIGELEELIEVII